MCPVSRWRSRSLQVGYSKVMFHPDFIQAGTGESVHCGNFALIFLYRPSAYWASVTLNWDSAIPPSNNQITFGDASKFNLECQTYIRFHQKYWDWELHALFYWQSLDSKSKCMLWWLRTTFSNYTFRIWCSVWNQKFWQGRMNWRQSKCIYENKLCVCLDLGKYPRKVNS